MEPNVKVICTINQDVVIRLDAENCARRCSCNCSKFVKWAICPHFVAYSNAFNLDWYGTKYVQPEKFVTKAKKGRKSARGRPSLVKKALVKD